MVFSICQTSPQEPHRRNLNAAKCGRLWAQHPIRFSAGCCFLRGRLVPTTPPSSFEVQAEPWRSLCCALMHPTTRRVFQAVLYEAVAVAFVGPVLGLLFLQPLASAVGLAVCMSLVALAWNYVFNN